jgi:DNA helicase-2/ATP-dependent DNA helicase PcrA
MNEAAARKLRKIKPQSSAGTETLFEGDLAVGNRVEHIRFGKGEVLKIDGVGGDKKAEIRFENGGLKKLLLRFAKLKLIQ